MGGNCAQQYGQSGAPLTFGPAISLSPAFVTGVTGFHRNLLEVPNMEWREVHLTLPKGIGVRRLNLRRAERSTGSWLHPEEEAQLSRSGFLVHSFQPSFFSKTDPQGFLWLKKKGVAGDVTLT